jgi:hypothetical protein
MNPMNARTRGVLAVLILLPLAFACSGCFNPFDPRLATTAGVSKPAPQPNTAAGVVLLFQWCWRNRAYDEYREIFTDDYRFQFATGDTAGNFYRDTPWTRIDELNTAQHLFVTGTPSQPPATTITLDYTQDLNTTIDPRPGKGNAWHALVTAQVLLRVSLSDGGYEVRGPAYFYAVRGDSALIPDELKQIGFKSDSTRWYLELWVDGTLATGSAFSARHPGAVDPASGFSELLGGAQPVRTPLVAGDRSGSAVAMVRGQPRAGPALADPGFIATSWGKVKAIYLH